LYNFTKPLAAQFYNTRGSAVEETARRFVSFNISLSHSRSFKITPVSRAYVNPCIPLKQCLYLVPFLRLFSVK